MDWKGYKKYVGTHNDRKVIWIQFPYNREMINRLKKACPAVKWSSTEKCWYARDTEANREMLGIEPALYNADLPGKLPEYNLQALEQYVTQLILKAYSPNTIKAYRNEFLQLLFAIKRHAVEKLTEEQLKSYFLYCVEKHAMSERHLNSRINAVKFYYEQVLHRKKMFLDIPRPKRPSSLPKHFSQKDIQKLFDVVENPKHLLMLKLAYGMGLRVSEIVNLQIAHIDSTTMQVLVEAGKGKKDRYVNLPKSILPQLRKYYKEYKPGKYLFEGVYGGKYSVRSVQLVFKNAMKKAKIRKRVGVHGLRHSYATHLLETGTDITLIQKLLGHKDIKTTTIYARVSDKQVKKVASPLDTMQ